MSAAHAMAAMTSDRVDFVDENDARGRFLALLKHVAHTACADTDEHLHEIRSADGEERDIGFARDRAREQSFSGAGRADQQDALRNAAAEFLKFFRIAQKFDELLHFVLCFLDASDVAEGDFVLITREHARFAFAKIERAFSGHADLLAEEKIENEQKKGDGQKTDDGLRDNVRFRDDGWLNSRSGEALLQVGVVIEVDRGPKRNLLSRGGANALLDVRAAQGLGGPPVFDHKFERIIFVRDNLFILQQLEETIIGDVFHRLHPPAIKEHGERNKAEGDRDEDDAAPVKIGFAPAGFILLLRIAIRLRHEKQCAPRASAARVT